MSYTYKCLLCGRFMTVEKMPKTDNGCERCDLSNLPMPAFDDVSVKTYIDGKLHVMDCVIALRELVRLKDIKERIEFLDKETYCNVDQKEYASLKRQYEDKDAAWNAARKALGD